MEVEVKSKPGFTVMGLAERGKDGPKFIPPLWEKFHSRHDEFMEFSKDKLGYGVMANYDEATEEFDYLAGIEVDPGIQAPEGLTTWDVPEQTYAVIPCTVPTIMEAYQFYHKEWLPNVEYEACIGEPEFELYPQDYGGIETGTMYMYFPIQKVSS